MTCPSLKQLWEVTKPNEREFCVREKKFVRVSQSRRGGEKVQLCAWEMYCREVLDLCHEQMSGHCSLLRRKIRFLDTNLAKVLS